MRIRSIVAGLLCAAPLMLSSCIGIYNNKDLFFNDPEKGTTEAEMIRKYGTPAFTTFADKEKIYTYKVRDNKYIILVGIYEGYDLVITCKNGTVDSVTKVQRPKGFALFQPVPWADTE